jgi:hypothetical protein
VIESSLSLVPTVPPWQVCCLQGSTDNGDNEDSEEDQPEDGGDVGDEDSEKDQLPPPLIPGTNTCSAPDYDDTIDVENNTSFSASDVEEAQPNKESGNDSITANGPAPPGVAVQEKVVSAAVSPSNH